MIKLYSVNFEIFINGNSIGYQKIQAPEQFLKLQFLQYVDDVSRDNRPIKLKMTRQEIIYDYLEQNEKVIDLSLTFENNAEIQRKGEI